MLNLFRKNKVVNIASPLTGEILGIDQVDDQVFSTRMLGDGLAVIPSDGVVVSPCDGTVIQIFPTNHAIGIQTVEGIEILIHIGIDTVELKGEGFKRLLEPGAKVKKGTPIVEVDLSVLKSNEKSPTTPIIITNMDRVDKIEILKGEVVAGETDIMKLHLK